MTQIDMAHQSYTRDLGTNLILRWSRAEDCERIGELYSTVFRRDAADAPNTFIAAWTRDMMSGRHPLISPNDFAVVEDTSSGKIVASTCLLAQTWTYEEIPFPVGRPEVVASLPEHRNRGLVRAIFELIHARSDGRGDMVQGITGIPYYYRQFGYDFALDLGGGKVVPFAHIPKLKDGETEPFTLRPATEQDLPLVHALYEREQTRTQQGAPLLVSTQMSGDYWQYALPGPNPESGERFHIRMIVGQAGNVVGYVLLHGMRWDDAVHIRSAMVDACVSLMAVVPSLLRGIQTESEHILRRRPDIAAPARISLGFGRAHPIYEALNGIAATDDPPYSWYVRVPDLPQFIRHVAPVLERRLADSVAVNYTGELRLTFYRGGLRLAFEKGRITEVEPWQQDHNWGPRPQAAFPPLVFLQLLFGHRSLDELRGFLPDVWAEDEAKTLLNVLFPRRVSWVMSLE